MSTFIITDKPIYQSKTMFVSTIQLILGFLLTYRGLVTAGLSLIFFAILFMALRINTSRPVYIKDSSYKY